MTETPNPYTLGDMGMSPEDALYKDQIHDVVAAADRDGDKRIDIMAYDRDGDGVSDKFTLDTDASEEQLATLLRLTERYCVVFQTLSHPPALAVTRKGIDER